MDKKLGKPSRSTTNTTTTTTTTTSPAKTTGLGKGRPGIPRKEQVSKRQERRREQQNEKRPHLHLRPKKLRHEQSHRNPHRQFNPGTTRQIFCRRLRQISPAPVHHDHSLRKK